MSSKNSFQITEKLRLAMRSLHRLVELKDMNVSNFLLDTEKDLFLRHFKALNGTEIQYLAENFCSYHEQECVEDAVATERMFQEIGVFMRTLN